MILLLSFEFQHFIPYDIFHDLTNNCLEEYVISASENTNDEKEIKSSFFLTKTQLSSVSENIGFRRWLLLSFLFFSFSLPAQIIFGDSASIHITGDAVIYHEGEIYQAKPKELATVSKKPEEKAKPKIAESKKAVEKKTVKKYCC